MPTHFEELEHTDPAAYFSALAQQPYTLFLDSADRSHPDAKYSFIAFDPIEVITLEDCIDDPFAYIQSRIDHWKAELKPEHNENLPTFQGGAAGLFAYDLGRTIETLPNTAKPSDTPDLAIGIYNKALAFDHVTNKAWFICHGEKAQVPEPAEPATQTTPLSWTPQFTPADFKARIARVIDYIHAGDIFQANISQGFEATLPDHFDTAAHYLHLRSINPAPFAGYMNAGDTIIASASPERFLQVKERTVETKPVKGTAPAHIDPQILLDSKKDRAENIMIVDLLRNDLSKVCETESIDVPKLCALETFKSVHHLVSTVTGQLKEDKTPLDLLRASFPGGSITGAPKIRAQEIIEELEEQQRGPYCGSLGYIGFNGNMDTNILIRTLIFKGGTVRFNVGGGITAKSEPEAEYQETLDKAEGLFKSFETIEKA